MAPGGERHIVIGTAGHVDHGKTTLTKALTGVDTDRLKEEKERALSIDLGFAPLTLPSGLRASVIDVPGHERFLKNMVAGVTGMDVVVLVVAADEGVMPQTREHVDIATLLDIKSGLVALTKVDLVDAEWRRVVSEEVAAALVGTLFEGAPIVPCSGVTGEGLDELLMRLDELAQRVAARDTRAPFYLAVDRIFVAKGFGSVATGTVSRGRVQVGSEVTVLPSGRRSRVRSIQVHGAEVAEAVAGQRAALNLHGVNIEDVERGDVLAEPGSLQPTSMLDVSLRVIERAAAPLRYWDRVRVHLGTSEIIARVVLLGSAEVLNPGESGFVQLRLERPTATYAGAHCVLRTYSPAHTFAGGQIVDPNPPKHRGQRRWTVARDLELRTRGSAEELMERAIAALRLPFSEADLVAVAGLPDTEDTRDLVDRWVADGRLTRVRGGLLAPTSAVEAAAARLREAIARYHQRYPLRAGMERREIRRELADLPAVVAREALGRLLDEGVVVPVDSERVRMAEHDPGLDAAAQGAADAIRSAARAEGLTGVEAGAIARAVNYPAAGEVIGHLIETGELVRVGDRLVHSEEIQRAREALRQLLTESPSARISEIRDALGSSRKAVVPLMEYFDRIGVTRRQGDARVAGPNL